MLKGKSKYIAFIDADDQWIKNKIEEQLSFMISGNIDFSHTSYKIIDEELGVTTEDIIQRILSNLGIAHCLVVYIDLHVHNCE